MLKPDKPLGGTELAYYRLSELVDFSHVNLISSICHPSLLSDTKPNIIWEQLSYDQDNVSLLNNPEFVSRVNAIVFVSHWQHEQFRKRFPLDNTRCVVIQNAVDRFEQAEKQYGKLKLIYTSTPWRGLHILVEALKKLNRDVDVDVYSGTAIYGPSFDEQMKGRFDFIYNELKQLGVNHIEYAPNSEVRKAVQNAHIFAYPSVFEETSCIAAIEALSAGCKVVTTNFGALYETCSVWADYVPVTFNLVDQYTEALQYNIDNYWKNAVTTRWQQQSHYAQFWSWDKRKTQWEKLLNEFK